MLPSCLKSIVRDLGKTGAQVYRKSSMLRVKWKPLLGMTSTLVRFWPQGSVRFTA